VRRLRGLAEEIGTYWRLTLAGDWAGIRAVLDAEIFHRPRRLAEDGAAGCSTTFTSRSSGRAMPC
jgi:hypothetical protein